MGGIHWHTVIVAGGSGKRFGTALPKQFALLENRPVIEWSISAFLAVPNIQSMIIVSHPDWIEKTKELIASINSIPVRVIAGGQHRHDSCRNGLQAVKGNNHDVVLIHDAARPLISRKLIKNVIQAANTCGAAIPVIEVKDSLVAVNHGMVEEYLNRDSIKNVQTPQGFSLDRIRNIHEKIAKNTPVNITDDGSLMFDAGYPVAIVNGHETNIKITTVQDLHAAREYVLNG